MRIKDNATITIKTNFYSYSSIILDSDATMPVIQWNRNGNSDATKWLILPKSGLFTHIQVVYDYVRLVIMNSFQEVIIFY